MVQFVTTILQFEEQAEKTGWTYIHIPVAVAQQLKPGNKKTFRVKGSLDNYLFKGIALMPMGGGDFIMALNATIRKEIKKRKGAMIRVQLEVDKSPVLPPAEFIDCLVDEPKALAFFNKLPKSHKNYFIKWIESAKTEPTKTKRIAQAVNALSKGCQFGPMIRNLQNNGMNLSG